MIPGTVAHQAPLSLGFSRQEHWSRLPFPPPRHLSHPGIKPKSPVLQADSLPLNHLGSPTLWFVVQFKYNITCIGLDKSIIYIHVYIYISLVLSPLCWATIISSVQFSSVAQLCPTHESQHARPPCPSHTPGVYLDSCPSSR